VSKTIICFPINHDTDQLFCCKNIPIISCTVVLGDVDFKKNKSGLYAHKRLDGHQAILALVVKRKFPVSLLGIGYRLSSQDQSLY
jgi:hypothetical protein